MTAAAVTGGSVCLEGCVPDHLEAVTAVLRSMGCEVTLAPEAVTVTAPDRPIAAILSIVLPLAMWVTRL